MSRSARTPSQGHRARVYARSRPLLGTWLGGYTGWVIPAHLPAREVPDCSRSKPQTAKRAPEDPCRGSGVGGLGCSGRPGTGIWCVRPALHPPFGPGRSPCRGPPWCRTRLLGQKARFHVHFLKVSQNGKVSPKYLKKAYVSPCLPKRVPKVTS